MAVDTQHPLGLDRRSLEHLYDLHRPVDRDGTHSRLDRKAVNRIVNRFDKAYLIKGREDGMNPQRGKSMQRVTLLPDAIRTKFMRTTSSPKKPRFSMVDCASQLASQVPELC